MIGKIGSQEKCQGQCVQQSVQLREVSVDAIQGVASLGYGEDRGGYLDGDVGDRPDQYALQRSGDDGSWQAVDTCGSTIELVD